MADFTVLDMLEYELKEHDLLQLSCVAGRSGLTRKIKNSKLSRPGLPLAGFFTEFSDYSIQVFGRGEQEYLKLLDERQEYDTVKKLLSYRVPCCVFTEQAEPTEAFIRISEDTGTPTLTTPLSSSDFSRRLYSMLDEIFAPTVTIHGVLVEVFGIGVLITGDSGIGKSEIALELIERGHRLISDDTVKLENLSSSILLGRGPNPNLAHHMEIRGLGIINLTTLYGVGAIRNKKQVQLSVKLEEWNPEKNYDRIGGELTDSILGITIPKVIIPVKPGRNIPIIIETAARNERLKQLGYNSGKEFDRNVMTWLESETAKKAYYAEPDEGTIL